MGTCGASVQQAQPVDQARGGQGRARWGCSGGRGMTGACRAAGAARQQGGATTSRRAGQRTLVGSGGPPPAACASGARLRAAGLPALGAHESPQGPSQNVRRTSPRKILG